VSELRTRGYVSEVTEDYIHICRSYVGIPAACTLVSTVDEQR
jgi:hypothetical protein